MKASIHGLFLSLLLLSLSSIAQREYSPEVEAFYAKAMSQINTKHVRWIKSTANEANERNLATEEVMEKAKNYGLLGGLSGQDIEAIAFLVMMQASKSAQEDLKSIMAQVKGINDQKEKLREAETALKDQGRYISRVQLDSFKLLLGDQASTLRVKPVSSRMAVSPAEREELGNNLRDDFDSIGERGEMLSLRMQQLMTHRSQFMNTLSNLLKKFARTQDNIISNLK